MSRDRPQHTPRAHTPRHTPIASGAALVVFEGLGTGDMADFVDDVAAQAGWGDVSVVLRAIAGRLRSQTQRIAETEASLSAALLANGDVLAELAKLRADVPPPPR